MVKNKDDSLEYGSCIAGKKDRYRLLGCGPIAPSGMSRVDKAEPLKGKGERVAIKIVFHDLFYHPNPKQEEAIRKKAFESIRSEASLLMQCPHPGLPEIIEYLEKPDFIAIVMKFIKGENYGDIMERHMKKGLGGFGQEFILRFALEICAILNILHLKGLIYRDLKLDNIICQIFSRFDPKTRKRIVYKEDQIVLCDLGLVKKVMRGNKQHTQIGTEGFAAPEQFTGKDLGPPTDIFALGVMMWCLAVGKLPDLNNPWVFADIKTIRKHPEPLNDDLIKIISKCTQTNFHDRYQTIEELQQDLEKIPGTSKVKAQISKRSQAPRRIKRVIRCTSQKVIKKTPPQKSFQVNKNLPSKPEMLVAQIRGWFSRHWQYEQNKSDARGKLTAMELALNVVNLKFIGGFIANQIKSWHQNINLIVFFDCLGYVAKDKLKKCTLIPEGKSAHQGQLIMKSTPTHSRLNKSEKNILSQKDRELVNFIEKFIPHPTIIGISWIEEDYKQPDKKHLVVKIGSTWLTMGQLENQ